MGSGTGNDVSVTRMIRGRNPHRPRQGASVPPCSPPSRCGLARSEFVARLARRPTLTASARGGELSARSGEGTVSRSNKGTNRKQPLCQLFVITIREGAPHVPCSIIPARPSSPHQLACSGLPRRERKGSNEFTATSRQCGGRHRFRTFLPQESPFPFRASNCQRLLLYGLSIER